MAIQQTFLKIWGSWEISPPKILGKCCSSFFFSQVVKFHDKITAAYALSWKHIPYSRVTRKVRKTQRQYPEFGHT
jgi:hypothetical protein